MFSEGVAIILGDLVIVIVSFLSIFGFVTIAASVLTILLDKARRELFVNGKVTFPSLTLILHSA